ncbi:MAG: prepilin-type N-terminal cleavage/methylation domain-containing protein [Dehalococcoidales bacterium]|nr:prepilin-type N-terminal cleavage/methylation domain-containing protein [Dehalococcoidales bacterium]
MRKKELGFTLIELMIAISIMALASVAAGMAIYQVFGGTEGNNDRMTALHQVQNAGYWISRDTQMAISVNTTDTLTFPDFLHIGWTEWDDAGTPTYHLINYTLENGSNNLYSLKRMHTVIGGSTEEVMVADYIFYQSGTEYSSNTSSNNTNINVNITSIYDETRESREYRIKRRAGL